MIKQILDEISAEPGTNAKMDILRKYQDNELLKRVLYLAESKRIKFYIKQIPEYSQEDRCHPNNVGTLSWALDCLSKLSSRELTGHDAIKLLKMLLCCLDDDDIYVLERIISKDLKIGMGGNINKVFPGLIEETPYMGAKSYDKKLVENVTKNRRALSQVKMDGRYANAIIRGGDVEFVSRAGEQNGLHDSLFLKELSTLGDEIVLNGELTVIGVPVRRTANGIVSSLVDIQLKEQERGPVETQKKINAFLKKHAADFNNENITFQEALDSVVYTCWDLITVDEYYNKKSTRHYVERFEELKKLLEDKMPTRVVLIESREVSSSREAMEHFVECLERGLEGTILKSSEGEWKDGKPNWQVKMKLDMNIDLKVVGFQMGTPGTKNEKWVSTLKLESSCGLLKTNPSNMDEKMMQYVTDNQDKLMGAIVEINCKGLSQDKDGNWSTMHPSVVEIREDKTEYDSLDSARIIEESVKSL